MQNHWPSLWRPRVFLKESGAFLITRISVSSCSVFGDKSNTLSKQALLLQAPHTIWCFFWTTENIFHFATRNQGWAVLVKISVDVNIMRTFHRENGFNKCQANSGSKNEVEKLWLLQFDNDPKNTSAGATKRFCLSLHGPLT